MELVINVVVMIPRLMPNIVDIEDMISPSKSRERKIVVLGAPMARIIVNSGILSKVVISMVFVDAISAIDMEAIIIITCNIFKLDIIVSCI